MATRFGTAPLSSSAGVNPSSRFLTLPHTFDSAPFHDALGYWAEPVTTSSGQVLKVTVQDLPALVEVVKTHFRPVNWAEFTQDSRQELLWTFLPELRRARFTTDILQAGQWLPEVQQRAAETLCFRLSTSYEVGIPTVFTVWLTPEHSTEITPVEPNPPQRKTPLWPFALFGILCVTLLPLPLMRFALLGGLILAFVWWFRGRQSSLRKHAEPVQEELSAPELPLELNTAEALAQCAEVVDLTRDLNYSLRRAEAVGDVQWLYNARTALYEYLPETLRLHGAKQGSAKDASFQRALAHIRQIGTQSQLKQQQHDWDSHERFLAEKAGAHK